MKCRAVLLAPASHCRGTVLSIVSCIAKWGCDRVSDWVRGDATADGADEVEHLEFQRLQALRGSGLLTSAAPPELEEICRRAKAHFRVAVALVTLLDRNELIAKARAGTDLETAPRARQFCDHTIRSDDVFVVPDATWDERFASNPVVTGEPFIRFYAGAPLVYLRQLRLGALCLLDPQPREFTIGDKAELALMAEEVVSAIVQREFDSKFDSIRLR